MDIPEINIPDLDKNLHGKKKITIPATCSPIEEVQRIKSACAKMSKELSPFHQVVYDGGEYSSQIVSDDKGTHKLLEFGFEVKSKN